MVTVGTNIDGQPIKKYKSIGKVSPKDAERALSFFITEIETGIYTETKKMSLRDFVDTWLKNYAELHLRPKTLRFYKLMLYQRILPELGHLQISKITPLIISSFNRNLQQSTDRKDGKPGNLSMQTVLHHHRLLHTIFEFAVKWQVILLNPVARTTTPKVPKKEATHYNVSEVKAMLEALSSAPYHFQVIVIMALETGMRESEMMGLLWSHIDLEKHQIDIKQTRHYIPKVGNVICPPKTESSRRTLSISTTLTGMLCELKQKHFRPMDCRLENDWVFLSSLGLPLHATTMSSWFPKFLKRHNLPHLRFHGLRHTSATLLTANGIDIASISKRLGHSTKMTTLNIYTHSLSSADFAASTIMEEVINKNKELAPDHPILN